MAANSSDEIFNFKCSSCLNLNRNSEAVKYCVECQGYCCQTCVNMHTAFVTLRNHTLLDKSSFKSAVFMTKLPAVPTERCSRHEIKVQDMYCGNHDTVGCTTCMALEHRTCTDVKSIPDVIDTVFKTSDADKICQRLEDEMTAMRKWKEAKETSLLELKESKEKTQSAIIEFRKEIIAIVENIEKESIKEVEKEYHKMEVLLQEEKQKAGDELGKLEQAKDRLNQSKGNQAQQFVLMKSAQKKITQVETKFTSLDEETRSTIEFSANQTILEFLRQHQTFGKLTAHSSATLSPRTTAYSIKESREMNIKLQNDSTSCNVEGACLTHDGLILFADSYNKKLKRADIDRRSIVDYLNLPSSPDDVCCVTGKLEAAVSLDNKTIQFVSLGDQMTCTRQLKMDHQCYGISHKDGRLYITTASSPLYIHDMSGRLLQTVSTDISGNNLFQQNRHVTFSDSGDNVFVADWYNGLITLDTGGNHIAAYVSDSDLQYPHDICTDRRGNLFVSCVGSNTVLQIAQDGKRKVGVVVRQFDGVNQPYCVCFDPLKNVLIVTQVSSDTVKVFDLQ